MVIMSEKNIRYLPVVEEGELMGIISINDLIRSTIQNHLEMIEYLKNYIHT